MKMLTNESINVGKIYRLVSGRIQDIRDLTSEHERIKLVKLLINKSIPKISEPMCQVMAQKPYIGLIEAISNNSYLIDRDNNSVFELSCYLLSVIADDEEGILKGDAFFSEL